MSKKILGKIILILIIFLLVANFAVSDVKAQQTCETRGTWLNNSAFNSDARRASTLASILDAKLNTVFLASSPLNNNYGWSIAADFDKMFILLKQNGLAVHVWVASNARNGNTYADYTSLTEQQAQAQWARDWLSRTWTVNGKPEHLDGFHMDYFWSGGGWGDINPATMNGVTTTAGKIHREVSTSFPGRYFSVAVSESFPAYVNDYEFPYLPSWYTTWLAQNPNNGDYGNAIHRMPAFLKMDDDVITWFNNGSVDFVAPMEYMTDVQLWKDDAYYWKSFSGNNYTKIFMGLPWYPVVKTSGGYSTTDVIERINYARSVGIKGFVIFELGRPSPPVPDSTLTTALKNGPFQNPAVSCLSQTTPSPTPTPTPSNAASPPPHCPPLGNIDCAGRVNALDFAYLISKWGTTDTKANLNNAGVADSADLKIMLGNWGKTP